MASGKGARVIVRYGGAKVPFEEDLPLSETVGTLKAHVMETFRLFEGATTFYDLYLGHRVLADLNETVGQVAGSQHELELSLVKQYHG